MLEYLKNVPHESSKIRMSVKKSKKVEGIFGW